MIEADFPRRGFSTRIIVAFHALKVRGGKKMDPGIPSVILNGQIPNIISEFFGEIREPCEGIASAALCHGESMACKKTLGDDRG